MWNRRTSWAIAAKRETIKGTAVGASIVLLLGLASCERSGSPSTDAHVKGVRVELPSGAYGEAAAWLDDDTIVIERQFEEGGSFRRELWSVAPDGTKLRRLKSKKGARCRVDSLESPQVLPDGRLGAIRSCALVAAPALNDEWSVVAMGAAGGHVETVADLDRRPPAAGSAPLGDVRVLKTAWRPNMQDAVADTLGNCGSMVRVTRHGVEPLDLRVGTANHEWNLAEQFQAVPTSVDCNEVFGTAGSPSADPGYHRIAFFVLRRAAGAPLGGALPGAVCVWDLESGEITRIVENVSGLGSTAWANTGDRIAFTGDPDGRGDGIWLVEPDGENLTRISDQPDAGPLTWSPDDRSLLYSVLDVDSGGGSGLLKSDLYTIQIPQSYGRS